MNLLKEFAAKVVGTFDSCKSYVAVAAVSVIAFASSGLAVAQTDDGNKVEFNSIVEFGDLFSTLTDVLGPIVAAALLLGLSIWGARYIYTIIKGMAR